MRISDWSSDVCSSDLQPFLSPRESDIEKPPMLLHLSLLAFPSCFLDRSELFRAAGRQNRQFAPARLKLPIETAHIAHALGVDRRICEDDQGRLQPLCPMHSQHADAVPLRGRVADNFNIDRKSACRERVCQYV